MVWATLRLTLLEWLGKLANLAGWPGVVRRGTYESVSCGVQVKVRRSSLFTVISVNGVDVYFTRLTGAIDGVGVNLVSGCTLAEAPESARFVSPPVVPLVPIRRKS